MSDKPTPADEVASEHRVMLHTAEELVCLCGESFSARTIGATMFRKVTGMYAAHLKEEGLRARLAAEEKAEYPLAAVTADHSPDDPGVENRYLVRRLVDPEGKHDQCRYFVLDPQHDRHARGALGYYAALAAKDFPALTRDLDEWLVEVGQDA